MFLVRLCYLFNIINQFIKLGILKLTLKLKLTQNQESITFFRSLAPKKVLIAEHPQQAIALTAAIISTK